MLGLRPYKPCDARTIISWCKDEITFRLWTADRYEKYPVTEYDMNGKYIGCNGDCSEEDNFYPMTAFDESGPVGHLIMRYTDNEKTVIRLGFVIVDDSKRGKGYGKEMICLAIKYAFEIYRAKKVTIGVFDSNRSAYGCYVAAGFKEVPSENPVTLIVGSETLTVLEMELKKEEYV